MHAPVRCLRRPAWTTAVASLPSLVLRLAGCLSSTMEEFCELATGRDCREWGSIDVRSQVRIVAAIRAPRARRATRRPELLQSAAVWHNQPEDAAPCAEIRRSTAHSLLDAGSAVDVQRETHAERLLQFGHLR